MCVLIARGEDALCQCSAVLGSERGMRFDVMSVISTHVIDLIALEEGLQSKAHATARKVPTPIDM